MKLLESKNVPINVHDGAKRNSLASLGNDGILSGFKLTCNEEGVVYATQGTMRVHGFRLEVYEPEEEITDKPRSYQTNYTGWNWLIINISYDRNSMDSSFSFSCYPNYFNSETDIENGNTGIVSKAIARFKKIGGRVTEFEPLLGFIEDEMAINPSNIDGWF